MKTFLNIFALILIFLIMILGGIIIYKKYFITSKIVTNKTQDSIKTIKGKLFMINQYDLETVKQGLLDQKIDNKYNGNGLAIEDVSSINNKEIDGHPQYYLAYDFSNKIDFKTLNSLSQPGNCVDIKATVTSPNFKDIYSFYNDLRMLNIISYKPSTQVDCYLNFDQKVPVDKENDKTIENVIIQRTERPSYDIGYDHKIFLSWGKATALGYSDASGLERSQTDLVSIYVISTNTNIELALENSARISKNITLIGVFEGGYAESVVFKVKDIKY